MTCHARKQTARRGPYEMTGIMQDCMADAHKFGKLVHRGQGWWQHPDSSQRWRFSTVYGLLTRGLLEVTLRCSVNRAALAVCPTKLSAIT